MKTLEIYGDSILKGVVRSPGSKTYSLCRADRFAPLKAAGWKVENRSKMGATAPEVLSRLKARLTTCNKGAPVLLEFGGNDCTYDWPAVSASPEGIHNPRVGLDEFLSCASEAANYVKSLGGEPIFSSAPPIDPEKYFDSLSSGLSPENILLWLGDVGTLARWHEMYGRALDSLAREKSCRTIDLRSPFLARHDFKSLICDDGLHPTEAGHAVIGGAVCDFFTESERM